MTTLSTHDTKAREDVGPDRRAVPGAVAVGPVGRPLGGPPPPPLTGLFLRTSSAWGRRRCGEHRTAEAAVTTPKAIREAARRHGTTPTPGSSGAVHGWLDAVLDDPSPPNSPNWSPQLEPHAHNDALGQKLLSLTVPGIPTSTRAPSCGRTASSTRTTAGPSTTPGGSPSWIGWREDSVVAAALPPPRPPRHLPARRLSPRCWRPVRPRSTSWRSYAVTTSWWRDAMDGAAAGRLGPIRCWRCPTAPGPTGSPARGCGSVHAEDLFGSLPSPCWRGP